MDIKQMQTLVALADCNSFTSAAKQMGMTKSGVSHLVRSMEEEIGTELVIHQSRDVLFTEAGMILLGNARRAVSDYQNSLDQIASITNEVPGELRLGIGSFVEPFIRKSCARLLKLHPALKIDAYVYRAHTLNQLLKAGKLDIAFTLNTAFDDEGIVSVPCIPVKIVAIMSKTHPLAAKDIIEFQDLCSYDCIMPDEDKRAFATINKYIDVDLRKIHSRIMINVADAALNMAEEEQFITFGTPQHIHNRPNLVAKTIKGLEKELNCNMHYLQDVMLKGSAKALRDMLTTETIPYLKAITE